MDETSRQNIIGQNQNLILIEDARISTGNFLTFADVKPLDSQLQDLNNTANMILLKQEGII